MLYGWGWEGWLYKVSAKGRGVSDEDVMLVNVRGRAGAGTPVQVNTWKAG